MNLKCRKPSIKPSPGKCFCGVNLLVGTPFTANSSKLTCVKVIYTYPVLGPDGDIMVIALPPGKWEVLGGFVYMMDGQTIVSKGTNSSFNVYKAKFAAKYLGLIEE